MACYIFKSQLFTKLSTDIVESISKTAELFKSQLFYYLFFAKLAGVFSRKTGVLC